MSLATKILGDDIVGISINTDKIVEVIRNIASRQREQDSRISEIESRLDDFFKNNTQKIDLNQIENFQSFIGTACEKFKALELNLKSLQNQINDVKESIEKKMQDSINDMMVTQSITNKSSFDAFESRINNLSDSVSEISGNLMKNNEEISNFPKEFTDLNSRVKYLYQEINRINQKMKNEEDSKKSAKNEDQSNNTSNNINSNKNNEKPPANFDTVKILIDQTVSQKINKEKLRNVIKNEVLNEVNDEIDKKLSKIRQIFTFPNNYTSQQDTQNNSNTNISNNPNNNLKNNLNNNNENSNQDKDALKNIENKNNDSNNNNNSNSNNNNSNSNNNNNSNINNDASKVVELSAKTAFLTSSLMNVSNTLAKLESRVEELEKNNSKSLSHNGNSKSSDSSYGIQKTLYDFGLLLEQCNKQSADHDNKIKSLSNQLSNLTCQIKDALYLMIDDFRLIHSHADGMEEKFLPDYSKSSELFKDDLNFEKNTSKYCMRFPPKDKNRQIDLTFPKTSESSEYSESKEDFSELNPNNRSNSNFIHIIGNSDASFDDTQFAPPPSKTIKKMTGLLHLVTSHAKRVERRTVISNHIVHAAMNHHHQNNSDNEQQSAQSQKLNQNSVEDSNEIESLNDLNNSNQENNKRVNFDLSNSDEETSNQDHDKDQNNNNKLNLDDKQMNGLHRNLEESSSFANARELCFMLGQFRREKDELMTSIDRKVDRDLVERLFNKFRIVVNEISEKINNLQNGSDKFATVKQIEGVIKMIAENKAAEKANKDFSTAVGRAPIHECLVCGRNVSSVAGQICPSARSLGACEDSSQFIYGDGGVFRKASERQSFIPRTKLPPLKDIPV